MGQMWKFERQDSDSKITLYLHGRTDHCVYNDLDSWDKLREERRELNRWYSPVQGTITTIHQAYRFDWPLTDHSCWLCEQPNMLAISPLLGAAINNTPLCPHGTGEILSLAVVLCFFFCGHTTSILVPWPEMESVPPAMQVEIFNHWTAREVPAIVSCFPVQLARKIKRVTAAKEKHSQESLKMMVGAFSSVGLFLWVGSFKHLPTYFEKDLTEGRCCCCWVASVMSDSVWPHRRQPTRLHRPCDSPGKNTGVGCHFLLQCRKVKSESEVAQSCLTLHNPMDCSLPGSSIHGIFKARELEWGAIAFSNDRRQMNAK